jgi:UDP-glucose 6-dehydrogenase
MKTVLVCGFGNIGKHLYKELSELPKSDYMTFIYDKYKSEYNDPLDLTRKYDYVFICVPTEMKDDGSCNTEEVLNAVNALKGSDTIIIKSAIPVGFVDSIKDNVNIIVSPEFWGTTQHCENPDFLILGGYRNYTDKVAEAFEYLLGSNGKTNVLKDREAYNTIVNALIGA